MELLDRYLHAVSFWLPSRQEQDVIRELGEDLHSQVEEREAELGRPLAHGELVEILERCGAPLLVAQRYLPQRSLIGPVVFPIYRLLLKLVGCCVLAPWLLGWLGLVILSPSFRAAHPGWTLLGTLLPLWPAAAFLFAFVTIACAALDRFHQRSGLLERWDPRTLPAAPMPDRTNRGNAIAEAISSVILALWWLDILRVPALPDLRIAAAPAIAGTFHWALGALWLALAAVALWGSLQPGWTRHRAAVRLALDVCSVALAVLLVAAGRLVEVSSASLPASAVAALQSSLNTLWVIIVIGVGAGALLRAVQDSRRVLGTPPLPSRVIRILTGD